MTRLSQFRDFAAEAADRISGNVSTVREAVGDLLGPGLTTPETPIESILGRLGDLLREGDNEELPLSPPFEGGQCPILYDYTVTRLSNSSTDANNCNESSTSLSGQILGPVSPRTGQGGSGSTLTGFLDGNGVAVISGEFFPNSDSACGYTGFKFTNLNLSVAGQGDDDCGSLPPEYGDDEDADPIEVGDDGELTGPNLPTLPDGWRPRLCGVDLELPCPGISICAGGFRARVGPCGIDIDLDPRGFPGDGGGVDNVDPETIGELDGGEDGDDEISVGDDVVSVWIETTGTIPAAVRVTHTSLNSERVERWLGFASTGTDTGSGRAYSENTPLHYGRNYYRLNSDLEGRSVKVRSPVGVTWVVTDTGERCTRCGRNDGDTGA